MSATPGISRRTFLGCSVSAGALIIGTRLVPGELFAQTVAPGAGPLWQAGAYLGIDVDGSVAIIAHRSEMGTGIRTSLPMVVAEELEADWSRIERPTEEMTWQTNRALRQTKSSPNCAAGTTRPPTRWRAIVDAPPCHRPAFQAHG